MSLFRISIPLVLLLISPGCREPDSTKETDDSGVASGEDRDGDGFTDAQDCNDNDESVYPGAPEFCDFLDNDCNGEVDDSAADATVFYVDAEADGYGSDSLTLEACEQPSGMVDNKNDCNDLDAAVHPGADEVCDGRDNNCDNAIDDALATDAPTWTLDADGDGYGGDAADTLDACTQPAGYALHAGDCDDSDPRFNPSALESDCSDSNDYNCDGSVGYADADGDGWAACEECDDLDAAVNEDAEEVCDGIDNDCDGDVDNDATDAATWYGDADGDGHGGTQFTVESCVLPTGYVASSDDCNDVDASAYPGAFEACDEVDNDCDGVVDEGVELTWYADLDGDGYGDASQTTEACSAPPGYTVNGNDCDDSNASNSPAALERCDSVDNDCDAEVDEDDAIDTTTWYADSDGDGYGSALNTLESCDVPSGYVVSGTDCNDGDAAVNPQALESCDGVDNDCDGATDEDDASDALTWYQDSDSDGYGDPANTTVACNQQAGFSANDQDCDDSTSAISPSALEVCDSTDNNCNGDIDESTAVDALTWYEDSDSDSYGSASSTVSSCSQPSGYLATSGDCDDTNAAVSPVADEYCDSVDNDCDGDVDELGAVDGSLWYLDADGDSYGTPGSTVSACSQPSGYSGNSTDCDDSNADQIFCVSCAEVLSEGLSTGDGAYTLDPDGVSGSIASFSVYCDMSTVSGGWTLIAKLTGNGTTGNRNDTAFWRQKSYQGDPSNLSDENALGIAYESVAFSDVMVRSLSTAARHIAWSHPTTYTSVFTVVDAGQRISDGTLLSGSVNNLDYAAYPDNTYHNDCSTLKYGFFGHDYYYSQTGIAGHSLSHGHTGGIVAASNFTDVHATQTSCITDWGFGAGYYDMSSGGNELYNINAHWWGAGNTHTSDFNAHGLFVR